MCDKNVHHRITTPFVQSRGGIPVRAFCWGSPAKTLRFPRDIIASNWRQIKKSFVVKVLTIANCPLLL